MVSTKQLKVAAQEMIDVLDLQEKGVKITLPKEPTTKYLVDFVKEAIPIINWEVDRFTTDTMKVLAEYTEIPALEDNGNGKEEQVPEEVAEEQKNIDELKDVIDDAGTLRDLKDIVNEYAQFKSLRNKLTAYKTMDALREAMIDLLDGTKAEEEKEKKAEEEKEKKAEAKAPEKPKAEKKANTGGKIGGIKHAGSFAEFADGIILKGGLLEEMYPVLQKEIDKRGLKMKANYTLIKNHVAYRIKRDPNWLSGRELTKDAIE